MRVSFGYTIQVGSQQLIETEDQSGSIKQPSRRARPATKKAKTSGKKKAGSKGQPSKRAPKVRIDHGELVQRDDGSFWFRANDSATWGKYQSSNKYDHLLMTKQNPQSATSLIAGICWPMQDGMQPIPVDQIESMVSAAQNFGP